jgi:hypothetical protein
MILFVFIVFIVIELFMVIYADYNMNCSLMIIFISYFSTTSAINRYSKYGDPFNRAFPRDQINRTGLPPFKVVIHILSRTIKGLREPYLVIFNQEAK